MALFVGAEQGRRAVQPVRDDDHEHVAAPGRLQLSEPNWTPEVTDTAISYSYTLTFAGFTAPAIWISG